MSNLKLQSGDLTKPLSVNGCTVTTCLFNADEVVEGWARSSESARRIVACVNAFEGIDTDRIAGKSLGEFLAGELYLNKAESKPDGGFGFTFSGLAVQLMAESFADQFKQSGAVNYLELLFEHADVGQMTVTMQRVEGLTPAQKLAKAEAERDELLAALVAFREDVSDNRHAELASVDPYSIDQEVLDKIDAAIARAKGGAA